eukprot:3931757-Rhodomonas_salina.1
MGWSSTRSSRALARRRTCSTLPSPPAAAPSSTASCLRHSASCLRLHGRDAIQHGGCPLCLRAALRGLPPLRETPVADGTPVRT